MMGFLGPLRAPAARVVPALLLWVGVASLVGTASCVGTRAGDPWIAEFTAERGAYGSHRAFVLREEDGGGGSRHGALSALTGSTLVGVYETFAGHHGSLLDFGPPERDGGTEVRRVRTPGAELVVRGTWGAERLEGTWSAAEGPVAAGSTRWRPAATLERLEDYPGLLEEFLAVLAEHYVFPERLAEEAWRDAVEAARGRVGWVRDDVEMVALVTLLVETLGTSHTGMLRRAAKPDETEVVVEELPDGTAWVRFGDVLDGVEAIDGAMEEVRGAQRLILDLRGSRGFDPSPGRLLAWLAPEVEPVGYMLGRSRAAEGRLSDAERDSLPRVRGIYDLRLLRFWLRTAGVAAGECESREGSERFTGDVVVLVDHRTASGCEPVVDFLRTRGIAPIVGRPTAGELFDAELYDLPAGWVALVPLGVYRTWDHRPIEGVGVEPDVPVEDPRDDLRVALEVLGAGGAGTRP